jgi:hypothetical protein
MFPFSFGQSICPTGRGGPTQFGLTQAVTISKPGKIRNQPRVKRNTPERNLGAQRRRTLRRASPLRKKRLCAWPAMTDLYRWAAALEEKTLRRLLAGISPRSSNRGAYGWGYCPGRVLACLLAPAGAPRATWTSTSAFRCQPSPQGSRAIQRRIRAPCQTTPWRGDCGFPRRPG